MQRLPRLSHKQKITSSNLVPASMTIAETLMRLESLIVKLNSDPDRNLFSRKELQDFQNELLDLYSDLKSKGVLVETPELLR